MLMTGLPDRDKAEKAYNYLAKSDAEYARAVARLEAAELEAKQAREIAFLASEGTQAERAAYANTSKAVIEANKRIEEALYEREVLKARRATAMVAIEIWRTVEASNRRP